MSGPAYTEAKLVRGRVARVTLTDECGMPEANNSSYVTNAFVTVTAAKNVDEGDEIKLRQADGVIGAYERGRRSLLDIAVSIQFVKASPGVLTLMTGDAVVLSADGDTVVGFTERGLQLNTENFGLELWTDTSGGPCVLAGKPVGYILYPLITQGMVKIDDITDGAITFTVDGYTEGNPEWGRGPYLVVLNDDTPAVADRLVEAVEDDEHRHFEITTVAPPAPTAGGGPVDITLPSPY